MKRKPSTNCPFSVHKTSELHKVSRLCRLLLPLLRPSVSSVPLRQEYRLCIIWMLTANNRIQINFSLPVAIREQFWFGRNDVYHQNWIMYFIKWNLSCLVAVFQVSGNFKNCLFFISSVLNRVRNFAVFTHNVILVNKLNQAQQTSYPSYPSYDKKNSAFLSFCTLSLKMNFLLSSLVSLLRQRVNYSKANKVAEVTISHSLQLSTI